MTNSEKPQKISIGFHGGQVLSARVSNDELDKLRKALGETGWHELAGADGTVVLDLTRVDYLLLSSDEHRVGF